MSCTVHSKGIEIWWKIFLALVGKNENEGHGSVTGYYYESGVKITLCPLRFVGVFDPGTILGQD
jgi:hypothetical protein